MLHEIPISYTRLQSWAIFFRIPCYRLSISMTKVFHFAWLTKTGNRTWKVCSIQGLTKRAGQEIRHDLVEWLRCRILSDWTDIINSQFSLRLNCYEMLWLYIDNSRLQALTVINRRALYRTTRININPWIITIIDYNMIIIIR